MRNSIKFIIAAAALGLASYSSAALLPYSGKVTLTDTTFDGGGGTLNIGGGEFMAEVTGGPTFYTFCLEIDQTVVFDTEMDYELSSTVDSQGDAISKGTAMLYTAFTRGMLYDRSMDADHEEAAGFLQAAIWLLEDENYAPFVNGLAQAKFFNVATNPYIQKVVSAFGSLASAKADDEAGKVKAMNITLEGEGVQDVLVYVPDSGTTLALLGLGFASVAVIARRRR